MDTLSTPSVEETMYMGSEGEEEEDEETNGSEEEDKGRITLGGLCVWFRSDQSTWHLDLSDDSQTDQSSVGKQQRPAWAPCFFYKAGKEVYNYVGQEIIIQEALDSYAGMIWPAVSSTVSLIWKLACNHFL